MDMVETILQPVCYFEERNCRGAGFFDDDSCGDVGEEHGFVQGGSAGKRKGQGGNYGVTSSRHVEDFAREGSGMDRGFIGAEERHA